MYKWRDPPERSLHEDIPTTGSLCPAQVVGIVKSMETIADGGSGRFAPSANKPRCMFLLYIDAISVRNTRASQRSQGSMANCSTGSQAGLGGFGPSPPAGLPPSAQGDTGLGLSMMQLHAIRDIASSENLFELLVSSVCPSIFGHEVVKAGLLLGMVGGRPRTGEPGERTPVGKRSDVHVLVVGDPGMGKSQMLTAVAALAPRGVYVCGNTTSSSGLTVTVVKDPVTGDFALEAGALVMGDQGCCCIDEFDKMSTNEHQVRGGARPDALAHARATAHMICPASPTPLRPRCLRTSPPHLASEPPRPRCCRRFSRQWSSSPFPSPRLASSAPSPRAQPSSPPPTRSAVTTIVPRRWRRT